MDNQNQKQDRQYQIPTAVADDLIHGFGIEQEDAVRRCEECGGSEEARGGMGQTVSLSLLVDEGAEPAAEGSFEDDIICGLVLEWLITTLNQANPRYGRIFRLLYDGAARQEIADELGIERQAVLEDIKKIRGLVQPLVKDIF